MEISKYRLMSGLRSHRPNPIQRNTIALGQAQTQAPAQQPPAQQQIPVHQAPHHQMYQQQYAQPAPQAELQAAEPRVTQNLFKAKKYDKDHTFNFLQHRWFKKQLEADEEITMSARQLKQFCDEAHEMGKMRQALLAGG